MGNKFKKIKFLSGKTQAYTFGEHITLWADWNILMTKIESYSISSNYINLKNETFKNLKDAKNYIKNYFN